MMPIQTNGAEFKRFYADPSFWPDGVWHDDSVIHVDGATNPSIDLSGVADHAAMVIESGMVLSSDGEDLGDLPDYFDKWRRQQASTVLLIEVPKDQADGLKAMLVLFRAKHVG